MAGRVLIGKNGSNYGLWVSKPSTEVTTATDKDMLFATTTPSVGQILLFQQMDIAAAVDSSTPSSTTLDYKNQGGVKTLHWYWEKAFWGTTGWGGEYDSYLTGQSIISRGLSVTNTYINSTTNRLTAYNATVGVAKSVIVGVFKEAAA